MNASAPILRRGLNRAVFVPAIAILIFAAPVPLRAQGSAVRIESFTLRPGSEVKIDNSRGSTRVEAWDSLSVRVVAEKKSSSGNGIESGELVMMGAGNMLIIECRPSAGPGRIDLTLYVPRQSQLEVMGGAFPVDVSGSLLGAMIDTTSGTIGYRIPTSDDASIDARSIRGAVRSTLALNGVEREGTQSIRGQLGNGDAQIILNSQTGNISLLPGPNSGRVARSTKQSASPGTDGNTVQSASSQGRDTGAASDRNGAAGSRTQDFGYSNRPQSSSGGSIDMAGADRSDSGGSSSRSGPFQRDTQERATKGGNIGMRTRIIPSNGSRAASRDSRGSAVDQGGDDQPQQPRADSSNPSSAGQPLPPDPTVTTGGGNGSVFAGSDVGDDTGSRSRSGPFERDRRSRNTDGGTAGLRVRIIPAGRGLNSRDSDVFPQPSQSDNRARSGDIPIGTDSQGGTQPRYNDSYPDSRPAPDGRSANGGSSRARSSTDPAFDPNSPASTPPHRTAPPVLRRNGEEDSASTAPAAASNRTPAESDEETVTLKAALVNLNVSVTNRAGLVLGNLKKDNFQLAENGEPQRIEFFAPSTAPFNLVLLIDLSGSIQDKLDVIKSAALKFLDILGPQDKVAVVSFTDQIRVVSQLTADRDELKRRIRAIERPQGGTAFYEAMWFSVLDTLRGTQGQRNAIVVLSDGVDSSMDRYNPLDSRVSFPQLTRRLEESDVIVFPIYMDTEYEEVFERGNSTSEAYAIARDQLERLAEVSGGQMFKAEKTSDLKEVYKQVAAAIRTVYSIGYQPTNAEKDGTFRRIRVTVDRPDAAVRTRKGYYAK